MARRPDNEILYKTFRKFLDLCLIQNRSLLWPDKEFWTLDSLNVVKKNFIDSPILARELSFEEKLEKQMMGSSKNEWAIICDTYYIYFLPSTHITFEKKQKDIHRAADKAGILQPPNNTENWEAQRHGFTRTAIKYHYKYAQFWLIILFAIFVKEHEDPNSVINKPHVMQLSLDMILDNIPNRVDRAYDMRHAMLYMAFPDYYERIISTRDKQRIIETYRGRVTKPMPSDIDESIRIIRNVLSKQYDKADRPFDFYRELKNEWKPKTIPPDTVTVDTPSGTITVPGGDILTEKSNEINGEVTAHTEIQWLLLKLGSDMGLDLWVAKNDKNREVAGQRFADLPRLKKELPIKFDEVTNKTIELIDVLWMKGNAIIAAFEIESTTSIYSGILRMADLIAMQPNLNIPLYLVAPDDRRNKVVAEVNRPVFSRLSPSMSEICKYISFSSLRERVLQITSVIKYLKPEFLEEVAESCELENDE